MIWWLLAFVVVFFLGVLFYRQRIEEYRLNQIEWPQREQLGELQEERIPIVVRGMPRAPIWTYTDVQARGQYSTLRVGAEGLALPNWISTAGPDSAAPYGAAVAESLAQIAMVEPWLAATWLPSLEAVRRALPTLFPMIPSVWAGARGLTTSQAQWTLLFPTDGEIVVTLMNDKEKAFLPAGWEGTFPRAYTAADTPFVGSLNYIDIILRPGHALWIPAHWKYAWENLEGAPSVPLVCKVDVHTPISLAAARLRTATGAVGQ